MTITTTKSLMLAVLSALSLGFGSAMAQESAGSVGPYETMQLNDIMTRWATGTDARAPQYGSPDVTITTSSQTPGLQGGGG
jgi:hypothetical protein